MEQCAGYKEIAAKLNALEQQLTQLDPISNPVERSGREAEEQIEEHFALLINALAARKASLIKEVVQAREINKIDVATNRAKLQGYIAACRRTMEAGAFSYGVDHTIAENIWKSFKSTPPLQEPNRLITTSLPHPQYLVGLLQNHGKVVFVKRKGSYYRADSVTTLAGSVNGKADGTRETAKFNSPWGVCFNSLDECLYVSDHNNHSIRKVTLQGSVSTFVSDINFPKSIAINNKDNTMFVTSVNPSVITKITSDGTKTIFAGNRTTGHIDGKSTTASFNNPISIAIDPQSEKLFVSDWGNNAIRQITPQGTVTTLAGVCSFIDEDGKSTKLNRPFGICWDGRSLLVCDNGNDKIRRVRTDGKISTICTVPQPKEIAITPNKTIIVSSNDHKIYIITRQEEEYKATVAAGGTKGREDGEAVGCGFLAPSGIAVHDPSNACFIADYGTDAIRKLLFADAAA